MSVYSLATKVTTVISARNFSLRAPSRHRVAMKISQKNNSLHMFIRDGAAFGGANASKAIELYALRARKFSAAPLENELTISLVEIILVSYIIRLGSREGHSAERGQETRSYVIPAMVNSSIN